MSPDHRISGANYLNRAFENGVGSIASPLGLPELSGYLLPQPEEPSTLLVQALDRKLDGADAMCATTRTEAEAHGSSNRQRPKVRRTRCMPNRRTTTEDMASDTNLTELMLDPMPLNRLVIHKIPGVSGRDDAAIKRNLENAIARERPQDEDALGCLGTDDT